MILRRVGTFFHIPTIYIYSNIKMGDSEGADTGVLEKISDEQRAEDAKEIQEELQPRGRFPEDLGETWTEEKARLKKERNEERRVMGKEDKKVKGMKKRVPVTTSAGESKLRF